VTGRPCCQRMSRQDTLAPLIPMGHHPLSHRTDPHSSPLSTCLMRPRGAAVAHEILVFTWPAGAQISVERVHKFWVIKYLTVSAIPTVQ
jgi:hypothetical protein